MAFRLGPTAAAPVALICALALGAFAACQGARFSALPTAGAGGEDGHEGGSSGGLAGESGAMGGRATGGELPTAGSSEGGAPSEGCTSQAECEAGSFCKHGSCASCAEHGDVSQLEYGNAQPLAVINVTAGLEFMRFARPVGQGSRLVYVRDFFGGHLWFTADPEKSPGAAIAAPKGFHESGGLAISFALPAPLSGYDFFFSRAPESAATDPVVPGSTRLFGAKLDADGSVVGATELPAPFNGEVRASYSIALSKQRAVWTQNIDGKLDVHLKTVALPAGDSEPVDLRLPLGVNHFASELELAPWLTADGRALFFTARAANADGSATDEPMTRLYVIGLSAAGQPQGTARMLTGLLPDTSNQTDPALSPDGCQLYFSAQSDAGMGLYRAERVR